MKLGGNRYEDMASIKPIDPESVHRICSGQVVIDVATASKELLENSLDAGGTSIGNRFSDQKLISVIKFKNYGLDLIEVGDDGSGISPDDYDQIGLHIFNSTDCWPEALHLETFDV